MVHLDYNLAYYKLSQARVNQLALDQVHYLFVNFDYDNEMIKNIYLEKDKQGFIFKIQFTNIIDGNIYLVRKRFYPETLYDYVTLTLGNDFYDFYLENKYNPTYDNIDLRAAWYFLANDRNTPITIKWVRDNKYIFSYKKMCSYYSHPSKERSDIQTCCKNKGLIRDPVSNTWYCPDHFAKKSL